MNLSNRSSGAFGALALLAANFLSISATAQQPPFAVNRYRPSFAGDRFFAVASPHVAGHLDTHGMMLIDYGHNPLVLRTTNASGDSELGAIVEHQLFMHLNATFALFERIALNVEAPIAVYQAGDSPAVGGTSFDSPTSGELGDLRIGLRGRLFGEYDDPLQIALTVYLWVPTGTDEFVSNDGVYGSPTLNVGGTVADRFVYAVDVGPEIRESAVYANVSQGVTLQYGLAAGVLLGSERTLQLGLEAHGAVTLEESSRRNVNAELLAGGRWRFADDWVVNAGAGPGLASGVGTPDVRTLLGLSFSPNMARSDDDDGDGIANDVDACPQVAGVRHDDPEKNGCPAPSDTDHDTIPNTVDACPDVPGIASSDATEHGCPDSDQDGIFDAKDACPKVAGVASDDPDKHGCPPPGDGDGDGVPDGEDACPNAAGPADQDPSRNGCPDTDGDTILDKNDACPNAAGPASSIPKRHGCPPTDSDGDGILDDSDACPNDAGVANADPAKNGCPKVVVTDKQIVIMERVEFATGRAVIRPESFALLDAVAAVFKSHPEITLVEVQGHTDITGGRGYNVQLSNARAKAVLDALVTRGVERRRLASKGYGPDRPVASNDTEDGRQQNRRVQFDILERSKK